MIPSGPGTTVEDRGGILWTRIPPRLGIAFYEADREDGTLRAAIGREPRGWHMSVSFTPATGRELRLPTWDELKDARYRFIPDRATMAALLPPRAEWVDVHPTCLHLWEIPSDERKST